MKNIHASSGRSLIFLMSFLLNLQVVAQTTYFEQDFNGAGPFTSNTPNSTQFNSINSNGVNSSFSIAGGVLSMTRGTPTGMASSTVTVVRSTSLSSVPLTMYLEVDINVANVVVPINGAAVFNIGSSLTNALPNNNNVFARFSINMGVNNTFQIRNVPGNAPGVTVNSTIFSNLNTVRVIIVMNNRGSSITYFDPRNASAPQIVLATDTYDIWVDNTPLVLGRGKVSGTGGNPTLSTFNTLFNTGEGTIVMDNLRIRDIAGVLPVHLTTFNAEAIKDRVELSWETAWERNSREFIVQRSSDLKEFGDIGRVVAAGETEGLKQYSFTDDTPLLGVSYYRLRLVDGNGSYEYSKVKDVSLHPGEPMVFVSPNPTDNGVVRIKAFGVDVSLLQLTSLLGQPIAFRARSTAPDTWEIYPESKLTSGLYLLHSGQNDYFPAIRFIVK